MMMVCFVHLRARREKPDASSGGEVYLSKGSEEENRSNLYCVLKATRGPLQNPIRVNEGIRGWSENVCEIYKRRNGNVH